MITGEIYVLRYIRLCARRRRTAESFSFRAASCVFARFNWTFGEWSLMPAELAEIELEGPQRHSVLI